MPFNILLISTYELGHQPFGLASPAAWLREAGATVRCLDLSLARLDLAAVQSADLVAFYLPMHMATRMAVPLIEQVRRLNPAAHVCCFGLYAPVNAPYLREIGVQTILGGEFEQGLVELVEQLKAGDQTLYPPQSPLPGGKPVDSPPSGPCPEPVEGGSRRGGKASGARDLTVDTNYSTPSQPPPARGRGQNLPLISLDRQDFRTPDRSDLPPLADYAHLRTSPAEERVVGYTEASRGCKHLCRHCPIVPVYGGRFRIVQPEVVLADIRQQVEAGAQHLTFGDPDFFNGPGHALPLVEALHTEFPQLTYDVTIKVEHLLKQAKHLPRLKATGCLFITTAVESFDEAILTFFAKHHTLAEFEQALASCRDLGLLLVPTFVAFTPWTTLTNYRHFLAGIVRLGLIDHVAPVQYGLRLLIPPGSRLLELAEMQALIGPLDRVKLSFQWQNPDPRVETLQQEIERLVHRANHQGHARSDIFQMIWERAHQTSPALPSPPSPAHFTPQGFVPYLTEPWYC